MEFADHSYDGLSAEQVKTLEQYNFAYKPVDKIYYGTKFLTNDWSERIGIYRDRLKNEMSSQGIPENLAQNGADFMSDPTAMVIGTAGVSSLTRASMRKESSKATRDVIMGSVSNPKLKNAVDQIYRPGARVGDGGLADTIRHELTTGELVGGKSHIQKGFEERRI